MEKTITIVGLHGFICDNTSATKFSAHCAEAINLPDMEIKIYSPDLPGHGKEPFVGVTSLDDYAHFLRKKLAENVVGGYVILGFSMGGMIALKYTELYPNDNSLLGIGVWSSPLGPFKESLTPIFKEFARSVVLDFFPEQVFAKMTKNKVMIDFMKRIEVNIEPLERQNIKKIVEILSNQKFDFNTSVPKCFVYGTLDPLVTSTNYFKIASLDSDNCETYLLPQAGHFGAKEGLNQTYRVFGRFIKKLITHRAGFATDL